MITETGLKYSDLEKIKIPVPPNAGDLWNGIDHADAANKFANGIARKKWPVIWKRYAVSPNNANLVVASAVESPGTTPPQGFRFCVGMRTNNERRMGLQFFVGLEHSRTGICFVWDKIEDGKRNTTSLSLPEEIDTALDTAGMLFGNYEEWVESFKKVSLTEAEAVRLLFDCCRLTVHRGRFPWGKLGAVDNKLPSKITAFDLLVAIADVVRTCPVNRQLDQLYGAKEVILAKVVKKT